MGKPFQIQIDQTNLDYAHVNNCQMNRCFYNAVTFFLSTLIYSVEIEMPKLLCTHTNYLNELLDSMDCDKIEQLSITEQNLCAFWIICYLDNPMSFTYSRMETTISLLYVNGTHTYLS